MEKLEINVKSLTQGEEEGGGDQRAGVTRKGKGGDYEYIKERMRGFINRLILLEYLCRGL